MDIAFSLHNVVQVAKNTLQATLIPCEWGPCPAKLNSRETFLEHLQYHTAEEVQHETFQCRLMKCSGRLHASEYDLQQHVLLSHLSRMNLPCPVYGCSSVFGRHIQLVDHVREMHHDLLGHTSTLGSQSSHLKPARDPIPLPPRKPPSLPGANMPSFLAFALPVKPSRRGHRDISLSLSQTSHKRTRLGEPARHDNPMDIESEPCENLRTLTKLEMLRELTVRRQKLPDSATQLSRPQYLTLPPIREMPPQARVGYPAFEARFKELENAGLIDGTGEWAEEEDDDDDSAPSNNLPHPRSHV